MFVLFLFNSKSSALSDINYYYYLLLLLFIIIIYYYYYLTILINISYGQVYYYNFHVRSH